MMRDAVSSEVLDRLERELTRLLYREAALLDQGCFEEWFELLSPDIEYRVPVRTTRQKRDGDGFSGTAFFFDDDYSSIKLRVARLMTDFAWSESPPARTRRSVTNIRLTETSTTRLDSEHMVISNLALFSFRGESPVPNLLTGERHDVFRSHPNGWKLRSRLVLLDTTIIGTDSLAIFL